MRISSTYLPNVATTHYCILSAGLNDVFHNATQILVHSALFKNTAV